MNNAITLLLVRSAAWLLLVSFLTGGYAGAALAGKIPVDGHAALASHTSGILGALTLFALAFCQPLISLSDLGKRRLAWLMIVPMWSNWLITAVKAAVHARGIDLVGERTNDTIFGLLNVFVVLPTLAATGAWVFGLSKSARTRAT